MLIFRKYLCNNFVINNKYIVSFVDTVSRFYLEVNTIRILLEDLQDTFNAYARFNKAYLERNVFRKIIDYQI